MMKIKQEKVYNGKYMTQILLCILSFFMVFHKSSFIAAQTNKNNTSTLHTIDTASINLKLKLTQSFINKGELKKGKELALETQNQAGSIGYESGFAQALLWESKILGHEGNYPDALKRIDAALTIANKTTDSLILSLCYRAYGNMYLFMGDDAKSLNFYFKGLAIEEKLKAQPNLHWFYNNIGNIYSKQKNFNKSLEYALKGCRIAEKMKDQFAKARIYSNIAGSYHALNKKDSALFYFNLSIKNAESIQDKFDIANSLVNAAMLYIDLKKYHIAKKYSLRSLTISALQGYTDIQIPCLHVLGNISVIEKDYKAAENYLMESLFLSKKINNKTLILSSYEYLSALYQEKKDYQQAFNFYQSFSELKDTMFNEENSKLITEMNTKYTTEKKEKEIELLKKNEDIQKLELSKKKNQLEKQRIVSLSIFTGFMLLMIVAILMFSRYRLKKKANDQLQIAFNLIEEKNLLIEKSNLQITDSILYAKRIQDAILPSIEEISKAICNDFFILYQPSQIVSGDFYWCSAQQDKTIFIIADCTGHGVPGAFMSMIGNTLLNEIINEQKITDTKNIAELLDEKIIHSLHQEEGTEKYDGMDISICCIDKANKQISFTGARHNFYMHDGRLQKIKGDSFSVGGAQHQDKKTFTTKTFPYKEGLTLYFLTDGFCDQSGGPFGKRFSSKQLETLLSNVQESNMAKQKDELQQAFENWKGSANQRDDVLVFGIRL